MSATPIRRLLLAAVLILAAGCGPEAPAKDVMMPKPSTFARAPFDTAPDGKAVEMFTLTNSNGMVVRAMSYGAIIQSIQVPDAKGTMGDVVLGFDSLAQYVKESPYFGAVVGRYGNRIAKGHFRIGDAVYTLPINNGPNSLHGGLKGFDKQVWQAEQIRSDSSNGVAFTLVSPDGDQGYPGKLTVRVTYTLMNMRNELVIDYEGSADKATPINLTNHSYFNLAGTGDILKQVLTLDADSMTPVDATLIPTGAITAVAGTPFDFRTPVAIGARIGVKDAQLQNGGGYDHNFVINRTGPGLVPAAHVVDSLSGRTLDVSTTQPGVQFYTGNFLDGTLTGKGGQVYQRRSAFCLETQHYPDSPNHANFPSTILSPGGVYKSRTVLAFGVTK